MGGRFLNKRFTVQDGFSQGQGDDSPAIVIEGGVVKVINAPLLVEQTLTASGGTAIGSLTASTNGTTTGTNMILNTLTVGSANVTVGKITTFNAGGMTATTLGIATETVGSAQVTGGLRVGASAGAPSILGVFSVIYTWNIGAIGGVYGSTNSTVAVDVAMSGAAVGDWVRAAPIGSFADGLFIEGAVFSAGNVHVRAQFNGTTGAYTPGNVPIKIIDIQM